MKLKTYIPLSNEEILKFKEAFQLNFERLSLFDSYEECDSVEEILKTMLKTLSIVQYDKLMVKKTNDISH